jgi:hypothetical protein
MYAERMTLRDGTNMTILIRRWSDNAEYRVPDIDAYNRLYKGKGYYIPFGPHATHTPDGQRIKQVAPRVPRISRKPHGSHTSESVSTPTDAENTGHESS